MDAPILVLDHVDESDVTRFVEAFRAIEAGGRPISFIVAPTDFAAALRLQRALVGAIRRVELPPLQPDELPDLAPDPAVAAGPMLDIVPSDQPTNQPAFDPERHWLRGGIPNSYEAESDQASFSWRNDMMQALFTRDYSGFGVSPVFGLNDALTWLADRNAGELDFDKPPQGRKAEARSALWVLEELGLIRLLPNYPAQTEVSLAAKKKAYVRDSGVLNARLGIQTAAQLRAHPKIGDCWEAYALETLIVAASGRASCQFYREESPSGADEIDLVLDFGLSGGPIVAIEFKVNPDRRPEDGYFRGVERIGATEGFVVHSGSSANLDAGVHRLDLTSARQRILELAR